MILNAALAWAERAAFRMFSESYYVKTTLVAAVNNYYQVAFVVLGHVAALILAHDRALALYRGVRAATRSQYWMLAVMVCFTWRSRRGRSDECRGARDFVEANDGRAFVRANPAARRFRAPSVTGRTGSRRTARSG